MNDARGVCDCGNVAPSGWRYCRACHAHNDLRIALDRPEIGIDEFRLHRALRYFARGRTRESVRSLLAKLSRRVAELEYGRLDPGMSEADYRAGKRRPNGADEAPEPDVRDDDHHDDDDDRHSLRPLSVTELLRLPTPTWLVRGLLPERGFVVMFGASGSGKTFTALDLACAIAHRETWFGRRVRAGGVIYVASEGHLKLRLEACMVHHGLDAGRLNRLRFVPATINLLRPESGDLDTLIAEIKKAAHEMGGVALVVLDTLNSMMPGGNENASEDMGAMILAARRIMAAVDCAALYVHHSGKDEAKGSRGHSSLKAAVDVEIQITGDAERTLEAIKVRDGEPGQRFGFRLEPIDLGLAPTTTPRRTTTNG